MGLEFFFMFIMVMFVAGLSCVLVALPVFLVISLGDLEKLAPYECGFQPFQDASVKFDVRFYLVAILFMIFDLEVMFLFPWVLCLGFISSLAIWSMVVFLVVLGLGFVYEFMTGALDW